ncbi:hypothetical protein SAMD00019534_051570 [Acytostelium subglobosum LB1]|uniref:hypothetical protein n=1 Tax=Acytostelium subglobosum LB1 TaxID=1410327 RepID=UPI0006448A20|nr:hypothetical protein SAMD00019534_051570 [Acytostelium subglobosum LB1]GAM21982.1 hypothetical protein SAMD00019534_051570 [Acytostelium subglobosum LB1]|eukprot:XP_012755082.1 hypothetical protein SAMD00019534_051570 [Acytostelium subglobosum LB1]
MATSILQPKTTDVDIRKHAQPNLYCSFPNLDIVNVAQIESMCLSRLSLLKAIATFKHQKETYNQNVGLILRSFIDRDEELYQYKDEASHFLLRMAMAESVDHDWFIQQESNLLRYRLEHAEPVQLQQFMEKYSNFGWRTITEEEYLLYSDEFKYLVKLSESKKGAIKSDNVSGSRQDFLKMPMQEVPRLISTKRVILKRGIAYLHWSDMNEVINDIYGEYLKFAMSKIREDGNRLTEQYPQVSEFFHSLPPQSTTVISTTKGKINIEDIQPLSRQSFPMCMRVMYDSLHRHGKLKHEGRLEFSTFLKGIGLSYEHADKYWRSAFRGTKAADFDKEYSYTLRHTYGLEGKGISYSPYSCAKIIDKVPKASDEVHGCPYLWKADKLEQKLREMDVDEITILDIVKSAEVSPNLSCGKHFAHLHKDSRVNLPNIIHPNQFYEASREYYKLKEELEKKQQQDNITSDAMIQ